jgi:hypothetical protein
MHGIDLHIDCPQKLAVSGFKNDKKYDESDRQRCALSADLLYRTKTKKSK